MRRVVVLLLTTVLVLGRKRSVKQKMRELDEQIRRDEADSVDPYLGGANSEQASLLTVKFKPMAEIAADGVWRDNEKGFREMVDRMQTRLMTGGIPTNMFRTDKRADLSTEGATIILVCNDQ